MKNSAKYLPIALLVLTLVANTNAQVIPYTNRVDFLNALTASNYTENFNSAPSGAFISPINFSGGGFNITANNSIQGNGLYKDVIGSTNVLSLGGLLQQGLYSLVSRPTLTPSVAISFWALPTCLMAMCLYLLP